MVKSRGLHQEEGSLNSFPFQRAQADPFFNAGTWGGKCKLGARKLRELEAHHCTLCWEGISTETCPFELLLECNTWVLRVLLYRVCRQQQRHGEV